VRLKIECNNAVVDIVDGLIAAPQDRADRVIAIPDGILQPGLINAHDHLRLNHFGRLGQGPYANAYTWGKDIHQRYPERIAVGRTLSRRTALLIGAWKNLLSGVTTVLHHDRWETDFDRDFPIRVPRIAFADALGMAAPVMRAPDALFALHVAEGTDAAAADEVHLLADRNLLDARFIAVHAVGPDAEGIRLLRQSGVALVWCPTSNEFLFDRTAPPALLAEGIDVLLGTDSRLTGAGNLLDELHAARGRSVSDARLKEAVGALAARRLGLPTPSLEPEHVADLVVLRRPLLEAAQEDVALVMVGGQLRVLDPRLTDAAGVMGGQVLGSGARRRWISDMTSLPIEPLGL